jgi:hypothetical protein
VGSQQLLLIILGTVIVGIAVTVGISLFIDHSSATNRDAISNDLVHAASIAQMYRKKPAVQGGGGGSFVGFDLRVVFKEMKNTNGTYSVFGAPTDSLIIIEGLGTQPGYDNTKLVKVSIKVLSVSTEVNEVN